MLWCGTPAGGHPKRGHAPSRPRTGRRVKSKSLGCKQQFDHRVRSGHASRIVDRRWCSRGAFPEAFAPTVARACSLRAVGSKNSICFKSCKLQSPLQNGLGCLPGPSRLTFDPLRLQMISVAGQLILVDENAQLSSSSSVEQWEPYLADEAGPLRKAIPRARRPLETNASPKTMARGLCVRRVAASTKVRALPNAVISSMLNVRRSDNGWSS